MVHLGTKAKIRRCTISARVYRAATGKWEDLGVIASSKKLWRVEKAMKKILDLFKRKKPVTIIEEKIPEPLKEEPITAELISDKNQPGYKVMPVYEGIKVLKILSVVIGETATYYRCIMDDGTVRFVPKSLFDEVNAI